jgi:cyanophycin synthetase
MRPRRPAPGGLGFDRCDVGIVTNLAEDHLGLDGIHSLEQMSRVKATVAESVSRHGCAVLNADNEWTSAMGPNVRSKVAFFSLDAQNPRILLHCAADGLAAVVEDGEVVLCDGLLKMPVMPVAQIPLTFGGTATCMTENVLPAVHTGYVRGLSLEQIRQGLLSFVPSPRLTPGRLNVFQFGGFRVVVDYATTRRDDGAGHVRGAAAGHAQGRHHCGDRRPAGGGHDPTWAAGRANLR